MMPPAAGVPPAPRSMRSGGDPSSVARVTTGRVGGSLARWRRPGRTPDPSSTPPDRPGFKNPRLRHVGDTRLRRVVDINAFIVTRTGLRSGISARGARRSEGYLDGAAFPPPEPMSATVEVQSDRCDPTDPGTPGSHRPKRGETGSSASVPA